MVVLLKTRPGGTDYSEKRFEKLAQLECSIFRLGCALDHIQEHQEIEGQSQLQIERRRLKSMASWAMA